MVRVKIPGAVGGVIKAGGILDDIADTIANPPPGPVGAAIGFAGQNFCNALGASPALGYGILLSQGVIGSIVCKPYWDANDYDAPVPGPPPFQGGQCPGESYNIAYNNTQAELEFCQDGSPNTQQFPANNQVGGQSFVGPISGLKGEGRLPSNCGFVEWWIVFNHANGLGQVRITTVGQGSGFRLKSVPFPGLRAVRADGGTECGDPPTELQPGPNPPPFPPGYQPGIDFGIDEDGDPFFEVPGVTDPITGEPVPFEDPFLPTPAPAPAPIPQPTGDNSPGEPDAIGDPIGDGVAGDGGEDFDFGEPPTGKVWVGCLVEFSVDNAYGNIPNTGPENTVYPLTVGNISLKYGNLRGTSTQVRSRFTELFRPNTALEVTGVFVQTRPNTSAIVRPVSATVCKDNQCSGE